MNNSIIKLINTISDELPVYYNNITIQYSSEVDKVQKRDIIRCAEFPIYNSRLSECVSFYKPISKLYECYE